MSKTWRTLILAWSLCLAAALPGTLPAATITAENLSLSGTAIAPQLLALAQLDQRIAANKDPKQLEHLQLQRHLLLQRLTGRIYAGDSAELVQAPSEETLKALRADVARSRRSADREQEMIAALKLNSAVLDAAFARLLDRLASQWAAFAPASAFDQAFAAKQPSIKGLSSGR